MKAAAGAGYATATDLADWLVRTLKMPFREAHHVTGRIVALASERGVALEKLKLADLQGVEPRITEDAFARARRRALGQEPHLLRRHGAGQRQAAGEGVAEAARGVASPSKMQNLFGGLAVVRPASPTSRSTIRRRPIAQRARQVPARILTPRAAPRSPPLPPTAPPRPPAA